MICLQTPSFGWSFQDGRQLTSKQAHHKQQVARTSPIFQISGLYTLCRKYVIDNCGLRSFS